MTPDHGAALPVVAWLIEWDKDRIRSAGSHLQRAEPIYSEDRIEPLCKVSYALAAVEAERNRCAKICEALQDRTEEAKALAKFQAADGENVSAALSRGQHWSAVSLYNSALTNAAVAIRSAASMKGGA